MNRQQRFEYLYKRLSDKAFINRTQTGDELPFYICPYQPSEKFALIEDTVLLKKKLEEAHIRVLEFDLFEMTVEQCRENDIWDLLKNGEIELSKEELKETFQNIMAPDDILKTLISQTTANVPHDMIFITGVGEVFPYLRTHAVLNNLQSILSTKPVIIFFPGEYQYDPVRGSTLDLFGRMHNDRFYRAFNLYEH